MNLTLLKLKLARLRFIATSTFAYAFLRQLLKLSQTTSQNSKLCCEHAFFHSLSLTHTLTHTLSLSPYVLVCVRLWCANAHSDACDKLDRFITKDFIDFSSNAVPYPVSTWVLSACWETSEKFLQIFLQLEIVRLATNGPVFFT